MALKVGSKKSEAASEAASKTKQAPTPAGDSMDVVLKALKKEKGDSIGSWGGIATHVERLPTGLLPFDMASGGGFPMGRMSLVYGKESCLDAGTFIQYQVRAPDGRMQNAKGGSIENLYRRFHGLPRSGKGSYQREESFDSYFTAPCINEEGRVFHNRIVDVVDAGVRPCFEVHTAGGFRLTCTAEHKIRVVDGFKALSDINLGTKVLVHDKTPFSCDHKKAGYRKEVFVKHHPHASVKVVNGCEYRRLPLAKAVFEARMNGLTPEIYRAALNEGMLEDLVFLDPGVHVHHKNEDFNDNREDNLVTLSPSEHGRLHAEKRHNNLRFMAVEDTVVRVLVVGDRQTYDVCMESPHNNFVADGVVVHNSGKTNLALKAIAIQQKLHPEQRCAWIAIEPFDTLWARHMGVDVDKLAMIYPNYAEEAIDAVEALLFASNCGLVTLDSTAAMITTQEAEKSAEGSNPGSTGLAGGKLARKTTLALREAEKAGRFPSFININQPRTKIGVMHGDPTTLPGGGAQYFQSAMTVRLFAKGIIDKSVDPNKPCRKETIFKIIKYKCPILAEGGMFEMCVMPQKGLKIGDCNDWNTISASLKDMGRLVQAKKGWDLDGVNYPVLDAIKGRVYEDAVFGAKLRSEIVAHALTGTTLIEQDVAEVDEDGVVTVEGDE